MNFIIIAADDEPQIDWVKESIDTVDSGFYIHYSYTDISLDAQGHSHICYRGEEHDLRYATNSVNGWSTEVVMDLSIGVARECAIMLDADGLPLISFSYDDGSGENLYYAYKDANGEWHLELVFGVINNSVGMENDIAIDENGRIHISHWEWSGGNLLYSFKENGVWKTETLVDGGVTWDKTAIAVDNQQKVHIVYGTGSQILHIAGQHNNWSEPEIVASCPGSACGPALVIDVQNNLHVTFGLANELQYGTNKSGEWEIQAVATDVAVAEHHAVTVDQNNYVHISFFDAINPGLYYANNVSGKWPTFTVESGGDIGRSNAIAVDQDNHVKLSYRNDFDGASINQPVLKYAETIDPIGSTSDPLQIYLPMIVKE
ncbi:MAG: hypothetical protein IPM53_03620 [Anaerolineaceae bacterium]|nr:hypothetical protein [Anaerolineaceae bacterium]